MSSGKPLLVIISAKTCGACQNFYKRWDGIQSSLQKDNKVEIKEIKLQTMNESVTSLGYPKELQEYIKWFPIFILFNRKNWDDVFAGKQNSSLDGIIIEPNKYSFTLEGLQNFIKDKLPLLESSKSPSIPQNQSRLYNEIKSPQQQQKPQCICNKMNIKPKYYYRK